MITAGAVTFSFHNLLVLHCPTGEAFTHQNYCESPARALQLARLTFTAAIWHVTIPEVGRVTPCAPLAPFDQLSLL